MSHGFANMLTVAPLDELGSPDAAGSNIPPTDESVSGSGSPSNAERSNRRRDAESDSRPRHSMRPRAKLPAKSLFPSPPPEPSNGFHATILPSSSMTSAASIQSSASSGQMVRQYSRKRSFRPFLSSGILTPPPPDTTSIAARAAATVWLNGRRRGSSDSSNWRRARGALSFLPS